MRGKNILEAYLDDIHLIKFYFQKISYNGKSQKFYLKHQQECLELEIITVEEKENYFVYHLKTPELKIGEKYDIEHEYGRKTPLQYGNIVKTAYFDQFNYTENDLGATFTNNTTTFKVYAPTAYRMQLILEDSEIDMIKDNGIFKITINQYLHDKRYRYRVFISNNITETIDPYCLKTTPNNEYSIAYDTTKIEKSNFVMLDQYNDAVIYEANIADFTAEFSENPKTFNSMASSKCVDYLSDLGITHLQLLPVTTCGSTDDYHPNLHYNWGYDITHFQALTNRYAISNSVQEFSNLVATYHNNNIAIVLDMVFNHVHDIETSPLQILCPNYYFQINNEGELSNGSYCGNDIDTTTFMSRKLIVDSCLSWVKNYHIDGLRLDLMGILDIDTVNAIYTQCSKINSSFILYGEGWNMPSFLPEEQRATIQNQHKMRNIAHFNDFFRDVLKGKNNEKGYLLHSKFHGDAAITALLCRNYLTANNSINYFECHDNHTLWDYLALTGSQSISKMKLLMSAIFLSIGIPFIHSGQEYCRSKDLKDNTYRDNSAINHFNWNAISHEMVAYTKKLIAIRKKYNQLKVINATDVVASYIGEDVIKYQIADILIIFNPTQQTIETEISGLEIITNMQVHHLTIEKESVYMVQI